MNCLVVLVTLWLAKAIDLTCSLSVCPDIKKGDHSCNPECMTSYCNYDTNPLIDGSLQKENSDCYRNCVDIDGCDPQNLGNGNCDSSCNTQNCGFDWGDCSCSPGCLDSMLGDGKCDEACDNWNCDLDNHDCGQCADGCFPEMLGNGICDSECSNEDCLHDYNDCQCAENCLWTDYGKCKPECMVFSCNFDKVDQYPNNWCLNTSLAIFSYYQQIIHDNFSYVAHLEDCYIATNNTCSLEKALNFTTCYEECNIFECNYANGNCQNSDICERAYENGCLSCRNIYFAYGVLWKNNCDPESTVWRNMELSPDGKYFNFFPIDNSSSKNPHVYFVTSDGNSSSTIGNGTYIHPYKSLSYCLSKIKYNYSIIYLLEGDGSWTLAMHEVYQLVYFDNYATSNHFENLSGKSIKIIPLSNSPLTIKREKKKIHMINYMEILSGFK